MFTQLFERVRQLNRSEVVGVSLLSGVSLLLGLGGALAFTSKAPAVDYRQAAPIVAQQFAPSSQPVGTTGRDESRHPNILFIMGDDIGWMQVGAYHRGLGIGETPTSIASLARAGCSPSTTPCKAARPGGTLSSRACIRCARA